MTPNEQSRLHAFIHHETTAGLILAVAALFAILAFNIDSLRPVYEGLLEAKTTVAIGAFVHGTRVGVNLAALRGAWSLMTNAMTCF